ncbi:MAG: hypothetical protein JWO14_384 [Solirubrobacterales bacterium]|nr:hypothetical protein [Solirubrobacterales bacterium]
MRGAQNSKPSTYTCPFCRKRLASMSQHVLIAPEDDKSKRRHAHMECVQKARAAGKLPTKGEWLEAERAPRRSIGERLRGLFAGKGSET